MFKPATTSLVLFLATLALQGTYASPTPFSFKIPGLPKYRSGSGWGDVTELPWKQAADAQAKAGASAAGKGAGAGSGTAAGAAAAAVLLGGGVAGSIAATEEPGLGSD